MASVACSALGGDLTPLVASRPGCLQWPSSDVQPSGFGVLARAIGTEYDQCCMYSSSDAAELVGQECLAAKVRRVHRVVVRIYDDALRPHGLTVAQLDLIATLLEHEGAARPSDLGRWLLMDRSTVTRNVERLRRLGLAECGPGATGREVEVRVTDDGRRLAGRSLAAWEVAQGEVAHLLGPDGVAALELLTQRVSA